MKTQNEEFNLIIRFLEASKSKVYKPGIEPSPIKRGPIGMCFDYSMITAIGTPFRYVEGLAKPHGHDWILHAWVTDGVHAYDPTWLAHDDAMVRKPVPAIYFGVEMDLMAVASFVQSTKYCGIIANAWRDSKLAHEINNNLPIHRFENKSFKI